MNVKRSLLKLTTVILFIVFALAQCGIVNAETRLEESVKMGLIPQMTDNEPNMAYSILDPSGQGGHAHNLNNIVKFRDDDGNSYDNFDIYCIDADITNFGTHHEASYDIYYDMKTERELIKSKFIKLFGSNIEIDDISYDKYNLLLAVADGLYLPANENTTENDRKELIYKILKFANSEKELNFSENLELMCSAFNYDDKYDDVADFLGNASPTECELTENALTENEISAVQQAVIWYFTNYEKDGDFDQTGKTNWLYYYKEDNDQIWDVGGKHYTDLAEYQKESSQGKARSEQARALWYYIISNAKANASKYADLSSSLGKSGAPAILETQTLQSKISGENTLIGPISITELNSSKPYTIDLEITNGGQKMESGYTLVNESGRTVSNLVKEDFYISIPTNQLKDISIKVKVNYDEREIKLWSAQGKENLTNNEEGAQQPVIEVTATPQEVEKTLELKQTVPFDLALRKYITKVNGVAVNNTRVPEIEHSASTTGATVKYKHRKDPVVVQVDDTITYELTVYNEGKKAGRPTEIVDQLPTGLEFVQVVNGNFDKGNYDKATNTVTLVRKSDNQENLDPYNGTLDKETVEIECKVLQTADTSGKSLTNIAWISKAYDQEVGEIVNQVGADIDSEPGTHPNIAQNNMPDYRGNTSNKTDLDDPEFYYKGQQDDDDFEKIVVLNGFDLKLVKFITAVNNQNIEPSRIKDIDVSKLNKTDENGELVTTADYKLNKEPVPVKKGDIVTYTFRIYNEGTIDGYAEEITEDVPEGLEFLWSEKQDEDLQNDPTLTAEEKAAIDFNQDYLWGFEESDIDENNRVTMIRTNYLSKDNEKTDNDNLIKAFGKNDGKKTNDDLKYKELAVKFRVISDNITGAEIRNEAAITEDANSNGDSVDDRDSNTEVWKKYEDDEDYDNVVLQSFDLVARKFIIAVSKDDTIQDNEKLTNPDGSYSRAPVVDTSKLNTTDAQGKLITTAEYNHSKEPVEVEPGDMVVYMIRVYNEGDIDGYAGEIKDHLPPYLTYVDNSYNEQYGWSVSEDGRTVTTSYLKDKKINKATKNEQGTIVLSFVDVPIMCKIEEDAKYDQAITNIADITEYLDDKKQSIDDRDSEEDNVQLPSDEKLPEYKDDQTGPYIPGQEDDDDFEKVIIKPFDLALRKFITKIENNNVDSRIPQVNYNSENDKIEYQHGKDPLTVVSGNTVEYTIRVFNEGARNGYAAQVLDDIPDGLVFLPDNETNKEYRWEMYRKLRQGEDIAQVEGNTIIQDGETYVITEDPEEAEVIVTDYLSKEQGEERMKNSELTENPNLLKAFNKEAGISNTNPDYKDVKVAFKVVEPNSSDKVIVNSAQISKDTDENGDDVNDIDSTPGEWNDGEDDQDKEYIELREFDLALRKWVTQAIVIDNGKQTVTQTGHNPYDDPEQVVKVEIKQNRLNQVTVKFRYSIRVTNEGDIEGYAKEVTDYVPQGLKFVASDNPGWTDEGNNVISTRMLENTLLKPGEYADVEVVLTWINSESGLGTVLTNTAEITEDENEYGIPDRDSTPDNKKPGEDDIDDAPVILSIKTGQAKVYFTLGLTILITMAAGVVLIKRYVI